MKTWKLFLYADFNRPSHWIDSSFSRSKIKAKENEQLYRKSLQVCTSIEIFHSSVLTAKYSVTVLCWDLFLHRVWACAHILCFRYCHQQGWSDLCRRWTQHPSHHPQRHHKHSDRLPGTASRLDPYAMWWHSVCWAGQWNPLWRGVGCNLSMKPIVKGSEL